ncbi:MAG: hypothetical protein [Siphoviridae sp. cttb18]|nr:MAG: hypothetical protein [Siphoviridae sp. cttb18]
MKFVHNFKFDPQKWEDGRTEFQKWMKFTFRIPGLGTGFRIARIKEGENIIFEQDIAVINNYVRFKVPSSKLQVQVIYTLEIEHKETNVQGT